MTRPVLCGRQIGVYCCWSCTLTKLTWRSVVAFERRRKLGRMSSAMLAEPLEPDDVTDTGTRLSSSGVEIVQPVAAE